MYLRVSVAVGDTIALLNNQALDKNPRSRRHRDTATPGSTVYRYHDSDTKNGKSRSCVNLVSVPRRPSLAARLRVRKRA